MVKTDHSPLTTHHSPLTTHSDMEVEVSPPALGEAATHLPWLSPCAAALVALTRASTAGSVGGASPIPAVCCSCSARRDGHGTGWRVECGCLAARTGAVDAAAQLLEQPAAGFIDWTRPDLGRFGRPVWLTPIWPSRSPTKSPLLSGPSLDGWAVGSPGLVGRGCGRAGQALACLHQEPPRQVAAAQQRLWGLD